MTVPELLQADPQRTDPAWRQEPLAYDHDSLLTFYASQLSRA